MTMTVNTLTDRTTNSAVIMSKAGGRPELLLIDGEAVVLGVDGISDFEVLGSRKHDAEVQLCAFYVLPLDGEDLRRLPLSMRKTNLDRLSARRPEGIFVAPFERGEIGPDLFRAACKMGLEGLVSKRRDRAYRGGRCDALDQGCNDGAPPYVPFLRLAAAVPASTTLSTSSRQPKISTATRMIEALQH
jgi:bifunctional non-homologous end joining protein LigD